METSVGFGKQNQWWKDSGTFINSGSTITEVNYNLFTIRAGGGISYFINEFITLDGRVNYNREVSKENTDNADNYRVIESQFSITAGFSLFL